MTYGGCGDPLTGGEPGGRDQGRRRAEDYTWGPVHMWLGGWLDAGMY